MEFGGLESGKKKNAHPVFGENWGEWGNKKATASERGGLAVAKK